MAKYNPECNHCGCYLRDNENFDLACTNPDCPTKQLSQSEAQYYNQMLQDDNITELQRLDKIIIEKGLKM
jgi:uncharacterized Zn ribbon protein